MPTLEIIFEGICVHFNRAANLPLLENVTAAERVVMPYIGEGVDWNGVNIQLHEPTLTVNGQDPRPFPFRATLSLDPLMSVASLTTSGDLCLPSLKGIFPSMEADPAVVVTGQSDRARLYFDLNEGVMSAVTRNGSACTRVTIETEEHSARLTIVNRDDGGVDHIDIDLDVHPTILIANTAKVSEGDQLLDFILSFAVGKGFPPDPIRDDFLGKMTEELSNPGGCSATPPSGMMGDIGPGCSNSTFP